MTVGVYWSFSGVFVMTVGVYLSFSGVFLMTVGVYWSFSGVFFKAVGLWSFSGVFFKASLSMQLKWLILTSLSLCQGNRVVHWSLAKLLFCGFP